MSQLNLNQPSALEQAAAAKQLEDNSSMENFQNRGVSLGEFLSHNAKTAMDANSFGVAALYNKGRHYVQEAQMDNQVDPDFRAQLTPDFIKQTAPGVPAQMVTDFLASAPNHEVYYKRVRDIQRQLAAKQELAHSAPAKAIAITGKVAEVVATVGAGPGAVAVAGRAGATGLAARLGAAAVGNAVPNAALELAQASEEGRTVDGNQLAGSMAIDGVVGGIADGAKAAEAARVGRVIGGPFKWATAPVKRMAEGIVSKFRGEAKTVEAVDDAATAVKAAENTPVSAPSGAAPGATMDAAKAAPLPDLQDALKGASKAAEEARIANKATHESPLVDALSGTKVADKVAAQGVHAEDAFKAVTSSENLTDTITAAQRYARGFGEDPLSAMSKQAELEGALEAHLKVDLPKGWLTAKSVEETVADVSRAHAAVAKTPEEAAALTKFADESAAKSKWSEGKRTIDIWNTPKEVDAADALAPQVVKDQGMVYTNGRHSYTPVFDSAVDKALLMSIRGGAPKAHKEAMEFLKGQFPGMDAKAIKQFAKDKVLASVRDLTEAIPVGTRAGASEVPHLRIPTIYKGNMQKTLTEAEVKALHVAPTDAKASMANHSVAVGSDGKLMEYLDTRNVAAVTRQVEESFGAPVKQLIADGKVRIVDTIEDIPSLKGTGVKADEVAGVFLPSEGRAYLVAKNLSPDEVDGVLLHEAAIHGGMRQVLGEETFKRVLADVMSKVTEGDAAFVKAHALVNEAVAAGMTKAADVAEEVLAYVVQNAPKHGFVKALIAKMRQWAYRMSNGRVVKLSEADLREMAVSSLKGWAKLGATEGAVKYSLFIGTKGAERLAAAGGKHAKLIEALDEAKAMKEAGADAEAIRQKTGWFEHPADKKWRWEMSTQGASGVAWKHKQSAATDQLKVDDVYKHDSLFEAYPELKDVKLVYSGKESGGEFSGLYNRVTIHGDAPPMYKNLVKDRETVLEDLAVHKQLVEDDAALKSMADDDGVAVDVYRGWVRESIADGEKALARLDKLAARGITEQFGNTLSKSQQSTLTHEVQHVVQDIEGHAAGGIPGDTIDSFRTYQRLAGEAEARLSQTRLGLSPEEIAARPPLKELDVPENELIVKFAKKKGKNASQGAPAAPKVPTPEQVKKALEEWNKEGYKEAGLLNPQVSSPQGGLKLPNSEKVAFARIPLSLPNAAKQRSLNVAWLPADKVGTDSANAVRVGGDLLLVNAVGKRNPLAKGSDLVQETADVLVKYRVETFSGRVQQRSTEAFRNWLDEKGLKDTHINDFKVEYAQKFNREWADGMRGLPGVSQIVKDLVVDIQKMPAEVLDSLKAVAQRQGVTEKSGSLLHTASQIIADAKHLTRVHSREARLDWGSKIGQEGIEKVYAAAIRGGTPGLTEKMAMDQAKEVVRTLDALDDTASFGANGLTHLDDLDAAPRQLIERMVMDELHNPITVKGLDGNDVEVSVRDLLDNDPTKLLASWAGTMHGIQALAEVGERIGVDLTSKRGWNLFRSQMKAEGGNDKAIKLLDAARDHILGKGGNSEWQSGSKLGNSLRQLLTMRYGMGFVFAQIADMGNQLPAGQLNRILDSFPGIADIKAAASNTGNVTGFSRDVANIVGLGLDHITPVLRQMAEVGQGGIGSRGIGMALHKAMSANGFYAVMDTIKTLSVNLQLYKLADAAEGIGNFVIHEKDWKHLSINGINKEVFERMKPMLAQHTTRDSHNVITGMDFMAMRKTHPNEARALEVMMYKVMKDASSEAAGIGQVLPFMTSELGRFLTQFQAAALVAHQRLRRDLLNFDGQVAMRWFSSFTFAAAGYSARTALMTGGDADELAKRMDPHAILAAAFRNSSHSGFLPNLISAASSATPWGDPLAGGSTTGRVSVNSPPAFDAVTQAGQAAKNISNAIFTDAEFTAPQAKQAMRGVGNPLWTAQVVGAVASNMLFPQTSPPVPKAE